MILRPECSRARLKHLHAVSSVGAGTPMGAPWTWAGCLRIPPTPRSGSMSHDNLLETDSGPVTRQERRNSRNTHPDGGNEHPTTHFTDLAVWRGLTRSPRAGLP